MAGRRRGGAALAVLAKAGAAKAATTTVAAAAAAAAVTAGFRRIGTFTTNSSRIGGSDLPLVVPREVPALHHHGQTRPLRGTARSIR